MTESLYQAYLYAFPLVVLELHIRALTNTQYPTDKKAPINQYLHAKGTATAEDKEIVHPNIDTVYSKAHFDLKKEPIVLHKPAADRYVSVELLDAFGNCPAILGSGGTGGSEAVDAVLVGPDFQGELPPELVRVDIPTNLCWTLTRILKNRDDEEEIQALQQQFSVKPLSAYGKEYTPQKGSWKPENDFIPFEKLGQLTTEEFFNIFNRLTADNPGDAPETELLKAVYPLGVGAGQIFRLSALPEEIQDEVSRFYHRAVADFRLFRQHSPQTSYRENWIQTTAAEANFGTDYLRRAMVAWGGFGALPASAAIYPHTYTDREGNQLDGNKAYLCHFDSEPPAGEFWSLTAYGEDQFLIPNASERYGINDRSEFRKNSDGSFDVLLQEKQPPEEWKDNWIPVSGKAFGLVLRIYAPQPEYDDGSWHLPQISQIQEA